MTSVNVDTLKETASDALDQVQRKAAPAVKEAKRQAGVLIDQSGELLDTVSSRASDTAADLTDTLVAYTKKNPLTALLFAVGAGALLLSAARSMSSRR